MNVVYTTQATLQTDRQTRCLTIRVAYSLQRHEPTDRQRGNKLTVVVVVVVLASNGKLEDNVLLLQPLIVVLQVPDEVNCLPQHSGLVQLTVTHIQTDTDTQTDGETDRQIDRQTDRLRQSAFSHSYRTQKSRMNKSLLHKRFYHQQTNKGHSKSFATAYIMLKKKI